MLDPIVQDCDIDFGRRSYFRHNNKYLEYLMHQFIVLSVQIIEQSSFFMGQYMFTELLGPVLDTYLRHYEWRFE